MFTLTYGFMPEKEYIKQSTQVMHDTSLAMQPGIWLVDRYPIREPPSAGLIDDLSS